MQRQQVIQKYIDIRRIQNRLKPLIIQIQTRIIIKNAHKNFKAIKHQKHEKLMAQFIVGMLVKRWSKRQAKFGKNLDEVIRKKIV